MKKLFTSLILFFIVINILPSNSIVGDGVSVEYVPYAVNLGIGFKVPTASLVVNGDALINETLAYDGLLNNTSATAVTINWGNGNRQKITLGHNVTFTFTAPPGVAHLTLFLYQDGTGSRTVTWPSSIRWSGGTAPTLTTTASRLDIVTCIYDGTSRYYCQSSLNFTPA